MKKIALLILLIPIIGFSQEKSIPRQFFDNLKQYEGKAFEGTLTEGGKEGDAFTGNRLVMHVLSVEENRICIPFFVGDNKSRTWVFTLENDRILLEHDHRDSDGKPEKQTMYGGLTVNEGTPNKQVFPANQYTSEHLKGNTFTVWWVTVDEETYTYNIGDTGSKWGLSVDFDLTKEVEAQSAPWGWEK